MNLALVGLRCSGKTTLGREVAERFGRPFIDLDMETLARVGAPDVAAAWRDRGEGAFREAEGEALRAALARDRVVIALGGGTPTAPGAAEALRAARDQGRAVVVYLRAEPATLRERMRVVGADANRPSVTGADPADEVDALFAQRDALYQSIASATLDASAPGGETLDALCELVIGQ